MPARKIDVDGSTWSVMPSGYLTAYDQDEFGLIFTRDVNGKKKRASLGIRRRARDHESNRFGSLLKFSCARSSSSRSQALLRPRPATRGD